jgi:hypothetical protein
MDLSAIKNLEDYELRLQKIEIEYFDRYFAWQSALLDELEKLDKEQIRTFGVATVPGDEATHPRVSPEAVWELFTAISDYAGGALFIYMGSVSWATTMDALDQLERHLHDLLLQVKDRKWEPARLWLDLNFEHESFPSFWSSIEANLITLLWEEIQPGLWRGRGEPEADDENSLKLAEEIGASVSRKTERRNLVDVFLLRCHESLASRILRRHIWQSVNHENPRQFQFWQAADPKATNADDRNFRRVLALKPKEFEQLLRQKGLLD